MKFFEKDDLDQPAPGKGYLGDILQWWSKRFPGPLRSTAPSLAPFSDHQPTAHRHLDHELWKSFLKLIMLLILRKAMVRNRSEVNISPQN